MWNKKNREKWASAERVSFHMEEWKIETNDWRKKKTTEDGSAKFNFHNNSAIRINTSMWRVFDIFLCLSASLRFAHSARWHRVCTKCLPNGRKVNEIGVFFFFAFVPLQIQFFTWYLIIVQYRRTKWIQIDRCCSILFRNCISLGLAFHARTHFLHIEFYTLWTNSHILNDFHYYYQFGCASTLARPCIEWNPFEFCEILFIAVPQYLCSDRRRCRIRENKKPKLIFQKQIFNYQMELSAPYRNEVNISSGHNFTRTMEQCKTFPMWKRPIGMLIK